MLNEGSEGLKGAHRTYLALPVSLSDIWFCDSCGLNYHCCIAGTRTLIQEEEIRRKRIEKGIFLNIWH